MTAGRLSLLALAALVLVAASGCRAPAPPEAELEFTRWRYNVDEKHDLVRVVGEIINHGEATVPQVEVYAALFSAQGNPRGENMTVVSRLRPGEKRTFALNVTSHGGVYRVEPRYQLPARR